MVYFLLDGPKNPQNDKNLLENSNFYTITLLWQFAKTSQS